MLNIFAIRCSLAFVPYLDENLRSFLRDRTGSSRVVKQGGAGLVMRYDSEVNIRFQGHDSQLNVEDVRHYQATTSFRSEFFDVSKLSDEVVLASVGRSLMLSHPQSEIWLEEEVVSYLVECASAAPSVQYGGQSATLPEWLDVSSGDGRLLISDQRTGRWVLLGEDHVAELQRRTAILKNSVDASRPKPPPTITVKGIPVHLQSAFKLANTMEEFASTGRFEPYADVCPTFHLRVEKVTEGLGLIDSNLKMGLNARETRKWLEIIRAELENLNAVEVERGNIRTTFADTDKGRWALQWGDEVLITKDQLDGLAVAGADDYQNANSPVIKKTGEFLLIMAPATGNCVAMEKSEIDQLLRDYEKHPSK
jgi:hypothetical protein